MINVDFADVRTVMSEMGMAMMGTGCAKGEDRAAEAAEAAIKSPLLDNVDLRGASGILVNITAGMDLSLGEFTEVGNQIEEYASENATIVVGTVIDPELSDEIKVTVVATGLDKPQEVVRPVSENVKKTDGSLDLEQIDLPTVLRRKKNEALEGPAELQEDSLKLTGTEGDAGYLDIPTFLRRQAD
jgi:cell division protein FtsZ